MPTFRAMILAAGHGTRLGVLGEDRPKPLLPVGTRPLVDHALSRIAQAGIGEVVINTFTHAERLERHVGDGSRFGVQVRFSRESGRILGTGGGIAHARPFFRGAGALVMNGKMVTTVDLGAVIHLHRMRGASVTLVLRADPQAERWGGFTLAPDGRIATLLGQHPDGSPAQEPATHMFTGISLLEPDFLDFLPQGPHCLVREGFVPWFRQGGSIFAHVLSPQDYWWEHSTPARYLQGNCNLFSPSVRAFFAEELPYHPAHSDVIAAPDVWLPDDVSIEGPVVLGPGAAVAPGVRLRNVVAWEGVRIAQDLQDAIVTPSGIVPVDLADPGATVGPALQT